MKSIRNWIYVTLGLISAVIITMIVFIAIFYSGGFDLGPSAGLVFIILLMIGVVLLLGVLAYVALIKKPTSGKKIDGVQAFPALSRIDKEMKAQIPAPYDHVTLEQFCEEFRNFAAGKLELYYSIDDIRRFIAGLAVSHIIILQGMSGTGKTSLAYAFGKFIQRDSTIIPIQPMWKERTDLLGYYNEFSRRFNETQFLETVYTANWRDDMFITILDEMNIARVEYYFAEFLSLMEIPSGSRFLDVISSAVPNSPIMLKNGTLKLPDNIWFIGTANNDDSTFAISDKVYDRAMIMNLDHKAEPFTVDTYKNVRISSTEFARLAETAKAEYHLRYKYKNKLERLDRYMQETFRLSFGNRINRQIELYTSVYVACGGDELMALDDILAKKVFRKLVGGNTLYLKRKYKELCAKLDELFGEDKMVNCKETIYRIVR